MKITSVELQKNNPHRFNIFLDGQFAFGADEDLVVSRRLVLGKEILAEDLDKILFEAEVGKLMERVYGLFNIRMRSEKEVRDYFRIKNYELRIKGKEERSDLVIESIVNKLKQKGLVNDLEFAKAWVEARSKKYGINRIKQELFQKGIERETINRIMNYELRIKGEEVAEKALERKMKSWKNLEQMQFRKKATEFLMRKGFEYRLVKEVVEKVIKIK